MKYQTYISFVNGESREILIDEEILYGFEWRDQIRVNEFIINCNHIVYIKWEATEQQ